MSRIYLFVIPDKAMYGRDLESPLLLSRMWQMVEEILNVSALRFLQDDE